ncbi:hypothetical protein BCR44DRAFT_1435365 [Catenaria anguillulae PL171]|uniref:Hemerythrin-like domain-containing protein n=1 Tax=Catenaria anguillulae PL171 TaxID=765915 RepID=A0A1Y2HJV8_9FUNG|nr:hypothetical protein BCR44DRAFT_1435365 [Catenaria anguillulae PL171]
MLASRLFTPGLLRTAAGTTRTATTRMPAAVGATVASTKQSRALSTNKPIDELILDDHREIFALWRDFQSSLSASSSSSHNQSSPGTSHQQLAAHHGAAGASAANKPKGKAGSSTSPQSSTLSYGGGPQFTTGEENTRPVDTEFAARKIQGTNDKNDGDGAEGASMKSVHERTKIANSLFRAIVIHSVAEEVVVYPELRAIRGDSVVDQLLADQQQVENELFELDNMPVTHPDFVPRLTKIMHALELHTADEEKVEMPELRARLNDEWLVSLGTRFQAIKQLVPTRPHPSAPTQPTLEALVGMMTAPLDYLRDRLGGREFVKPSSEAIKEETKVRG